MRPFGPPGTFCYACRWPFRKKVGIMYRRKGYVFFMAIIFVNAGALAQSQAERSGYLRWFDRQVGIENTGLYKGILYKEQYRTLNENTQFIPATGYLPGTVSYNGQYYPDQQLRYDAFTDNLHIKVPDRLGGNTILLFSDRVTEFTLGSRRFIRLEGGTGGSGLKGFYEVTVDNPSLQLLTRHTKRLFDRKDRSSLYYEFLDQRKEEVLFYKGTYHPLGGKNEVIRLFPEIKDPIQAYYSRARAQRRTDPHAFATGLAVRIASLLPTPDKPAL